MPNPADRLWMLQNHIRMKRANEVRPEFPLTRNSQAPFNGAPIPAVPSYEIGAKYVNR